MTNEIRNSNIEILNKQKTYNYKEFVLNFLILILFRISYFVLRIYEINKTAHV